MSTELLRVVTQMAHVFLDFVLYLNYRLRLFGEGEKLFELQLR